MSVLLLKNKMKKTLDLTAVALIIQAIFIFVLALRERGILMLTGIIGTIMILVVEGYFLINKWWKRR